MVMFRKSSVVVESQEMVRVEVCKMYKEEDRNFENPITKMLVKILNVEINLTESSQSNIINLLNKSINLTKTKPH